MAKRNYQNNYSSVTQILAVLRKIGLESWFKANTAEFCNRKSSLGKKIGSEIHNSIEQYIKTGSAKVESEHPEEVTNALNSFILFRKENPLIQLSLAETPLTSEQYQYNGTIDALSPPMLCDWKSGEAKDKEKPVIYDEAKSQVAAYVHLWNENNLDNQILTAHIVALAKDKIAYNIYTMEKEEIDEWFNEVFLSALKIKNYETKQKQLKKEKKNAV